MQEAGIGHHHRQPDKARQPPSTQGSLQIHEEPAAIPHKYADGIFGEQDGYLEIFLAEVLFRTFFPTGNAGIEDKIDSVGILHQLILIFLQPALGQENQADRMR